MISIKTMLLKHLKEPKSMGHARMGFVVSRGVS